MAEQAYQPDDRELAIRTILSEANGQGPAGMAAVAAVIRNRMAKNKQTAGDVVLARNQFEPWNTPGGPNDPMKWDVNSPQFAAAAKSYDDIMASTQDPTGGATHFFAPVAQSALGRNVPKWAQGQQGLKIGGHTFYKPEGAAPGWGDGAPGIMAPQQAAGALTPTQGPQQGSPEADMPAVGAQEAQQQGIMSPSANVPPVSTGDALGRLSAAFFMRDSPQQAQAITGDINTRLAQNSAFARAQQASNKWNSSGAYKTADGKWMVQETNAATGATRERDARPTEKQAEDPAVKTRQEVVATEKLGVAENTLGQLSRVQDSVAVLRQALQLGTFELGPDKQGGMVIRNITGNSTENDRKLKSMETQIIEAAIAMAAAQKGALTNFKFKKDMDAVMPSFAQFDNKAAYEALERLSHGLTESYVATANTAVNHAKGFERLQKKLGPAGEDIDIGQYYRDKIKANHEREAEMSARRPDFMARPGRGQAATPTAPAVGLKKGGYTFQGGDPSKPESWKKD